MLDKLEYEYPLTEYPLNAVFILVPVLALVFMILAYRKKERILKLMKIDLKIRFKNTRNILILLGMALMFFSLLGPKLFIGFAETTKEGLDIYVLIDTSKSMLVEDIQPNRITRAKKIIENLIDKLEGDRIGFIPFSSDAYVQMPLTDDYQLARMFLDVIDTDMISGGGTNIAAAINLADKSFKSVSSSERVVVIISDGEEQDSDSQEVVKKIKDNNLRIYTIGVGTEKGGLIPVYDDKGEQRIGYKKDQSGNIVTSRLTTEILKKLAQSGNGSYYQNEADNLVKDLSSLKRSTLKTDKIRKFHHLYQYFLGPGILLFLAAFFLPERRNAT